MSLCRDHFLSYVLERVRKTIARFSLLTPQDRVLVAVSGGKDSLALFDILHRLGYSVGGLHIDTGITGFSERARRTAEEFVTARGAPMYSCSLQDEAGAGIPQIAYKLKRVPCALCGVMRRYLMNRFACEHGFAPLATGHNLDDEGATLLGNIMNWNEGYLATQSPLMPAVHPRLAKKVKPLVLLSEREILAYCVLRDIPYQEEVCPHARGGTSLKNKEAVNLIEFRSPGTKIRFYQEFLKHRRVFASHDPSPIRSCAVCGYPTTGETCHFCRILERYRELISES
jgi:uncharacterized protein (TIGR00269 family)